MTAEQLLVGVFVGGRSSRMGRAKGLLQAPHEPNRTLVERSVELVEQELGYPTVLVGQRVEYAHLRTRSIPDAANDAGPLSGLVALLREAELLQLPGVIALACDMPYFSASLLGRLARELPQAVAVCPRSDGKYEPLFARYALPALVVFERALLSGRWALQPCLKELQAEELEVSSEERKELMDWDSPEDLAR